MKIKFWGVRGSIPTPLTSQQIKSRISAVIQRAQPEDLSSPETREAFLARLPAYLFGTVGGNTTCMQISAEGDPVLIFDAGTGIRELGYQLAAQTPAPREYHIFLTHFHWDHLQGLPFFKPAFNPKNTIYFYSPVEKLEEYLRGQMKFPYFPIEMQYLPAQFRFIILKEEGISLEGYTITWKTMKHPGTSHAYRISHPTGSILIATDSEITEKEFVKDESNQAFFNDADLLVLDSQYTLEEAFSKTDWGHSSYSMGVDLAAEWKVKNLVLFHHEPLYSDRKILTIERTARWYLDHLENNRLKIIMATEGLEISI